MSRGVVLWPDADLSNSIVDAWWRLEAAGIRTLASQSHGLHRPHLSLFVAEDLDPHGTLAVLRSEPPQALPIAFESLGVFPQGVLYLACVPTAALLTTQERVVRDVRNHSIDPWPFYESGGWVPHLTVGTGLTRSDVGQAFEILAGLLPMKGEMASFGVEDGDTGERWMP